MAIERLIGRKLRTEDGVNVIKHATFDGMQTNLKTMELKKVVSIRLDNGEKFVGLLSDVEGCLIPTPPQNQER